MKIKYMKGKRNRYKFPIGIYISKIPIYPLNNDKVKNYRKNMRTINFRIKRNVYTILIKI
jgi:hypothetical protein